MNENENICDGGARLPAEEGHLLIWPVIEKAATWVSSELCAQFSGTTDNLSLWVKDSHPGAASLEKFVLLKQYYLDM